jgi:protease PrsW
MIKMILIAIAPSLALLIFIYQKDRYDREPPKLLLKLFLLGAFSTIPVYFIERFLITYINYNAFFKAYIIAGFSEESIKFIIVISIAFASHHYDEKLDGIVYCVFTSLGFATAENLLYILSQTSNLIYTGLTRALLSVPAHMLFAITMGYYLSLAKFSDNKKHASMFLINALLIPILLHGTFDFILMSRVYGFLFILIAYVIYLWKINLKRLNYYATDAKISSKDANKGK